ncbi:hypothetical protein KP78_27410 [Jeotgalibacillus soli]|uniref:Uncharacterized protein n=1 Tax=Jeotgalibacillus soli TaxID=889306 RepID=A0A0C2VL61_9BACL|nr:hypothetical protein KP78_27410 [Jeotgalibacillus soli]
MLQKPPAIPILDIDCSLVSWAPTTGNYEVTRKIRRKGKEKGRILQGDKKIVS